MTDNYLKSWFDRAERMEEEQKTLGGHKRDLFTEAKGKGYNAKALRLMLKERKEDEAERDQLEVDMALYRAQLGMAVSLVRDDGVSLRKAAKAAGVSKSSVHRALAVPAASPEPVEQGDRQSLLRDGGAPVATSTVGPAVATLSDSHDGQVIVGNTGGDYVARPELLTIDRLTDDDAPAGALKAGSTSEGDSHECGRLTSEPEVARVAPSATDDLALPSFLRRTA